MKLGIDAKSLSVKQKDGVAVYAENLIKNIIAINHEDQIILYTNRAPLINFQQENVRYKILKAPCFWTQLRLPLELYFHAPDVMLFPTQVMSPYCPCKKVVVIHDLAFLIFKNYFSFKDFIRLKLLSRYAALRADHIIADSRYTKYDVIRYYHINPKKISAVYPGVDSIFRPINQQKAINYLQHRYGIKNKYILYVGTIHHRKNILNLIQAFRKLNSDYQLVLVGQLGLGAKEIIKEAGTEIRMGKVIFTNYINKEDLLLFYNGASVFVYPSFYEGFGLPVLEAMACGCPVITSRVSSLPEVVGECGLLVDPYNIEEMASAIKKIIENKNLANLLKNKSLERVKQFTWQECAKKTLQIIKNL